MLIDEVKSALEGATPGPWLAVDHTSETSLPTFYIVPCNYTGTICELRGPSQAYAKIAATARLISLAPDMARKLIAAEEMADATEVVCDQVYNRVGGVSLQAVAALRAALTAYRKAGEDNAK